MNATLMETSLEQVRGERELMKMLMALWRDGASSPSAAEGSGPAGRVKAKLLQIKMHAYDGCPPIERDLWATLFQEELRLSEQRGRRVEDSNLRRRIETLGIINAAIENVLHFRKRAVQRPNGASLNAAVLRHEELFGSHICDLARSNLELIRLFARLNHEPDDE